MRPTARRIGPADDNELLAVEALRLHPDPAVAWCIGPIRLLGDGALETQAASLFAEARPVTRNMLTVAQPADLLPEQAWEPFLAFDQCQLGRACRGTNSRPLLGGCKHCSHNIWCIREVVYE